MGVKLEFLGNYIAVAKIDKASGKPSTDLFVVDVEISTNYGVVKHIGKDALCDFIVGDKVYYSNNSKQLRIAGKDLLIMEPENVIAIVKENQEG